MTAHTADRLKYVQAAGIVRDQVSDGTLRPGDLAPSGATLARLTGFSTLTCRKALRTLIADGVLVPGLSANARPRVSLPTDAPAERHAADAARSLSAALAARRRAARLKQPELAVLAGVSLTTVGHAETGRLWQSRRFWYAADQALDAGGELLRLHDAYRAATTEDTGPAVPGTRTVLPPGPVAVAVTVAAVTVTWSDGTATIVHPPPAGALNGAPPSPPGV
jgi:DNA-binding transcriptional regulator YhcF (GntR family)